MRLFHGALGLAAAAGFGLALLTGSVALGLLPLVALCGGVMLVRLPPRTSALVLLFLGLGIDSPQDAPMDGKWHSPTWYVGYWLFHNLSQNGLPGFLSVSLMHGLVVLSFLVLLELHPQDRPRVARCARLSWLGMGGAIALLLVWGIARGGADLEAAYWQVRLLVMAPLLAWWFARAVDFGRDGEKVEQVILAAALLKLALGFWFYYRIARPAGLVPPVITSHGDTALFCLAVGIVGFRWLEAPTRENLRRAWLLVPLLWGIYLNNRRLAYVGLAAAVLLFLFLARRSSAKRRVIRSALLMVPCGLLFLAASWQAQGPWVKPLHAIKSMAAPRNARTAAGASTLWREVEDYNLSRTMAAHPLGVGLGHEYERVRKAADIGALFELWRYIPHNMLFGMLEMGGPLGFLALWLPLVVAVFLSVRLYRWARSPLDRRLAWLSLYALTLFAILTFGDMGTQYWDVLFLLALALAIPAQRAVAVGAWPSVAFREAASPGGASSAVAPAPVSGV